MSGDGEPTLGEVIRRLDAVSLQLTALAASMAEDRREAAKTYVRYDVYEARHSSLGRRIEIVEEDRDDDRKFAAETRRQLMFLILGAFVTSIGALIVAAYLGSGGTP